jgi:subtilisin family serine protease
VLTLTNNYPNDTYLGKKKTGKTWITVGASSSDYGDNLAAPFSNYNKKYVDVFAPGQNIYATFPDDEYSAISGTSMAAPMVAGIAALLRSYFPDLKATQVKEIIEDSALPVSLVVVKPGSEETISFADLSATGGLANAYTAVKLAEQTKGKKKKKKAKTFRVEPYDFKLPANVAEVAEKIAAGDNVLEGQQGADSIVELAQSMKDAGKPEDEIISTIKSVLEGNVVNVRLNEATQTIDRVSSRKEAEKILGTKNVKYDVAIPGPLGGTVFDLNGKTVAVWFEEDEELACGLIRLDEDVPTAVRRNLS